MQVPMMHQTNFMDYVRDDQLNYESVTIPYMKQKYEMTVYLRRETNQIAGNASLSDLLVNLAKNNFSTTARSLEFVDLKMPKMKFSWKRSLVDALKLRPVFDSPNLEGITSLKNIRVSSLMHATELEVDERGTIATATSGVEISVRSGMGNSGSKMIEFHVNRPFLVTIAHVRTRALLFAGIIRKPIV